MILQAVIDEKGSVREVRVLRGQPLLDDAAIHAVGQWTIHADAVERNGGARRDDGDGGLYAAEVSQVKGQRSKGTGVTKKKGRSEERPFLVPDT